MKRTLAITATTAMLALSLAGCGAERNGDVDLLPDMDGTDGTYGTTATDTMRNDTNGTGATSGTGTTSGASANSGLNGVTGAVNRGTQYGSARYGGTTSGSYAGSNAVNNGGYNATYGTGTNAYTATNNGGLTSRSSTTYSNNGTVSPTTVDRYALMLENARVHDSDGYLLDGENAHYRTY